MTDRNGKEVKVGAKAVLLKSVGMRELIGRVGTIRAISSMTDGRRGDCPIVRISDGEPMGNAEYWSSWAEPKNVSVVD